MAPLLLTVVLGVVAAATPKDLAFSRLLPAPPALAASMWSVGATVALGAESLVMVVTVELIYHHSASYFTGGAVVAVTAAAG